MKNIFQNVDWSRIEMPRLIAFLWFNTLLAYVATHLSVDAWRFLQGHPDVSMVIALFVASAERSFFTGPAIKPKTIAPPSYSQLPPAEETDIPLSARVPSEFRSARPSVHPREK